MNTEAIDRQELVDNYKREQAKYDADIRHKVLELGRIDVLAREVLGFELKPLHLALMRFEARHKHSLQMAFRGAGKSTVLTTAKCIFEIVKNPNIRILISSKTITFAKGILREIKAHIEDNDEFRRIFGDLVGEDKWHEEAITVADRTIAAKEATITVLGVGGQVVGQHFDLVIGDDLVEEGNARTQYMRDKVRTWYFKVLHPALEPHAELHIIGTRYHYDDLYGHLEKHEMKGHTQVIPALDEKGRSPWPEKFPAAWFAKKRRDLGLIIFNSQYQCDTEAMVGEIFDIDDFDIISADQVPTKLPGVIGVDLAIKDDPKQHDKFAMVGIKFDTRTEDIYVVCSYSRHLKFSAQRKAMFEWWDSQLNKWCTSDTLLKIGIESNAYQDAQCQQMREDYPAIRIKPIHTHKDKVTRAKLMSARSEAGKIHIVEGQNELIEQLVLMPNGRFKDLFDALDIAIRTALKRRRRKRRDKSEEPGLI